MGFWREHSRIFNVTEQPNVVSYQVAYRNSRQKLKECDAARNTITGHLVQALLFFGLIFLHLSYALFIYLPRHMCVTSMLAYFCLIGAFMLRYAIGIEMHTCIHFQQDVVFCDESFGGNCTIHLTQWRPHKLLLSVLGMGIFGGLSAASAITFFLYCCSRGVV